jgi:hypothetical protein
MVKVVQIADDGTEAAVIVLDDFTVEVVYSGIADMLRDAALSSQTRETTCLDVPSAVRQRREKILARVRS